MSSSPRRMQPTARLQRHAERATAAPYRRLTPYGWWLRAQVSRSPPPPLPDGDKAGDKVLEVDTGANQEDWVIV